MKCEILSFAAMHTYALIGIVTRMSEGMMSVSAAMIELGIPAMAVLALARSPRLRRLAVVLLGRSPQRWS
jgi:hypothetical protein